MGVDMSFFKKHWVLIILGLILFFGFGLRVYFYSQTSEQTLWWDEADYMTFAKKFSGRGLGMYEYKDIWSPRRPFLYPVLTGSIMALGLGEAGVRFMQIIFSMFFIFLSYLLGKELFNDKIGLITGFGMSVLWLNNFLSMRLLVGMPSATLALASLYFFWRGYVKREKTYFIYLSALFFGLGLFIRHAGILMALPIFALILSKEKLKFLKNKQLWIFALIVFLILLPNILYLFMNYENPLKSGSGIGEGRFAELSFGTFKGIWNYISFFPNYLGWVFLIVFLFGCLMYLDLFFGYDMITKDRKLQRNLMLFLWTIVFILFFGYQGGKIGETMPLQPRYLIYIFPAVFMMMGVGLVKINKFCEKYNRYLGLVVVLGLLLFGGYYQINQSKESILSKTNSYKPVKDAALWMKNNLNPNESIITNSVPQTRYYTGISADYVGNEKSYQEYIMTHNPKYFVVSVFERSGDWFYKFPEKHNLKPVNAWFSDKSKTQPLLVIYEFSSK